MYQYIEVYSEDTGWSGWQRTLRAYFLLIYSIQSFSYSSTNKPNLWNVYWIEITVGETKLGSLVDNNRTNSSYLSRKRNLLKDMRALREFLGGSENQVQRWWSRSKTTPVETTLPSHEVQASELGPLIRGMDVTCRTFTLAASEGRGSATALYRMESTWHIFLHSTPFQVNVSCRCEWMK